MRYAYKCDNFCFHRGVLSDGWGIEEDERFLGINDAIAAWQHVYDKNGKAETVEMYLGANGDVYAEKDGAFVKAGDSRLSSPPLTAGYRLYGEDVTLLCTSEDGMNVYDGTAIRKVDPSPLVTSMTLHYERLFATTANEPYTVRFSDDLDPTNWAEGLDYGGFLQLADGYGKTNKVISFLNYVYVLRDYGISRIVAYADQSEFSVSNLYVSAAEIYPRTAAVCGDRVVFLASDGLYAFDGLSTAKILSRLGTLSERKESATAAYFGGKYYLAYSSGGEKNDSLLVFDLSTGVCELSVGVNIDRFTSGNRLGAISGGKVVKITRCGKTLDGPTVKVWRTPFGALLSPDKKKKILSVSLETATKLKLRVLFDSKEKTVTIKPSNGIITVPVGASGKKIGFEIETAETGTRISSLSFVIA